MRHAKRMRRIILSSVATMAPPCFSTLSHKRHDLREKVVDREMCVLILATTFTETFPFARRSQRDIVINVHWSSCKVLVILV